MKNKHTNLVDHLKQFSQALNNLAEALQLAKEHDEKYKHHYANRNRIPQKQM